MTTEHPLRELSVYTSPTNGTSFKITTSEAFKQHRGGPYGKGAPDGVTFPIHDPFGLRKAVVPVFRREPDGTTVGLGTAFHIDGWGALLTADHVVEHTRERYSKALKPNALIEMDIDQSSHAAILLGYGLVFGTVALPEACWAPISRISAIIQRHDDPMAELRGESAYRVHADMAGMRAHLDPQAPAFHALPVDFRWQPQIGERVLAVGYPELDLTDMTDVQVQTYLKEGMFGAYGTITNLFPSGRDRARPTPAFEVQANWLPGMSGGPVFNRHGNVVGVVSYSLSPSEEALGVGYATYFNAIPDACSLAPSLDVENPGYRRGFGVFCPSPWHLAQVTQTWRDAETARARLGNDYEIAWGSHRLGSDEFIVA
ncbi:serine protease [Thauera aminoaromatica]|nr:serine protease [Thauera aminoaromatica]